MNCIRCGEPNEYPEWKQLGLFSSGVAVNEDYISGREKLCFNCFFDLFDRGPSYVETYLLFHEIADAYSTT